MSLRTLEELPLAIAIFGTIIGAAGVKGAAAAPGPGAPTAPGGPGSPLPQAPISPVTVAGIIQPYVPVGVVINPSQAILQAPFTVAVVTPQGIKQPGDPLQNVVYAPSGVTQQLASLPNLPPGTSVLNITQTPSGPVVGGAVWWQIDVNGVPSFQTLSEATARSYQAAHPYSVSIGSTTVNPGLPSL